MEGFFNSIYFRISVFILLCFFSATWYINSRVQKNAIERVNSMTTNVSINNIPVVTNILDSYEERLLFIKEMVQQMDNEKKLSNLIVRSKKLDSSIDDIYLEPFALPSNKINRVQRKVLNKDGKFLLQFSSFIDDHSRICLLVDLVKFHDKLADNKGLNYAYVTILYDDIYLYHPDENKIGSRANEQDLLIGQKILSSNRDTTINANSDYLNIPVYSYYNVQDIDGEKWIFTTNMPDLGLSDSIRKTGNDFLIISLLAICSFLTVFSLGILRWRKEVIHRREIEQQNMNLQLKNEQHKQTLIAKELENLKSGLNPHFLFNSLGSLRVLIGKDANVAKDFATTLSNLYRYMLKQENQNTVTLREELEFTQNYINLQKIRFANKIVTEISLDEELMEHKVLPISLQLLVENCIKHTRISDSEPLRIRIFAEDDLLVVVNNYNQREPEADYSGKGIDNLVRRYTFLTKTACQFGVSDGYYFAKIPILDF